ncbi:MAG: ROK family transcriptional regulator [Chitinophagaceae bacterium]|nr:ROK family transcriptional regulator [Chitinophagaceae bacterium]
MLFPFPEMNSETMTGVAYKNLQLKKQILSYLANTGHSTITDLSREFNVSTPKVNDIVLELIKDGLIKDFGKTISGVGRRPNLYGVEPDSFFFIGMEVKKTYVNIGLMDFQKKLVRTADKLPYWLDNTPASLEQLCTIVRNFITDLKMSPGKILGIGINLSGRVNHTTGYSYSYFNFNEAPLSRVIEEKIGIYTYLENDSRAMAYGEFCCGVVNGEKNVLFINVDHGIGMGIQINGQLYYGKSGFAGEFGHIPIFDNEILCHCGKKGCLETEASGSALIRTFIRHLEEGASSSVTSKHPSTAAIGLDDIIEAANNDDMLAIELIAQVGEKLGKGIATIINLYNPELIILGGSLSLTGDIILLPVKSAINKYSLSLVNNDTLLKRSILGEKAGVMGACLLVRDKLLSLA